MLKKGDNVFILRPDGLGDLILFLPALTAIKKVVEEGQLVMGVQEKFAGLFDRMDCVDQVVTFDKANLIKSRDARKTIFSLLQEKRFDLVAYPVSSREPFFDHFLLKLGAKQTVLLEGDGQNGPRDLQRDFESQATHVVKWEAHLNEKQKNQHFTSCITGESLVEWKNYPKFFNEKDSKKVRDILREYGIEKPFLFLTPFGGKGVRDWGKAKWLALIDRLTRYHMILYGSEEQFHEAEVLVRDSAHAPIFNLNGKLSIPECSAMLSLAELSIGVETFSSHLSAAVGKKSLTLMGGGHFGRFLPLSSTQEIVSYPMECFGCNWKCKKAEPSCVTQISVEMVAEKLSSMGLQLDLPAQRKKDLADLYRLASVFREERDSEKAVTLYQQIVNSDCDPVLKGKSHYHLAKIYEKMKNNPLVEKHLLLAVNYYPLHLAAKAELEKIKHVVIK